MDGRKPFTDNLSGMIRTPKAASTVPRIHSIQSPNRLKTLWTGDLLPGLSSIRS